ncbi:MAG: hypothetical protein RJA45_92 [Actinomycetota bacterium]|jgi:hypothetical protein
MNNKSSGLGCGVAVIIAVLFYVGQFLFTNPLGWVLMIGGVTALIATSVSRKKKNQLKLIESLENSAQILDDMVAGKAATLDVGFSLQKGEKLIYALSNVALTEYQSTGSTYSGGSVGVSFPLVGSIRGNVGGQSGQITKNPEQLMIVDQGRAIFTDQRIIFSGAKLVRDWDLDKAIEVSPGPNGFNVKIAVSNRERTSGLQSLTAYEFGPGFAAAYVFTLHTQGAAEAKKWVSELTKRMRDGAASERAKLPQKAIETK